MTDERNLNHSVWECKYHIVWIPKCRRKRLYGQLARHLGEIFHELARHKERSGCFCLKIVLKKRKLISVGRKTLQVYPKAPFARVYFLVLGNAHVETAFGLQCRWGAVAGEYRVVAGQGK